MFRMFRRPKKQATDNQLALGTGDRDEVCATTDSDALAHDLLKTASVVAQDLKSGEEFTVELTGNHQNVHHLEVMLSLVWLAPRYDLRVGTQFNNSQSFIKL